MSNIILAFIVGVLVGIGYTYMRYNKMLSKHMSELEQLKINGARIDGQIEILNIINGIEETTNA